MNLFKTLLASVSTIALAGPAFAQTDENTADSSANDGRETIIVTATRREESLQDVPISVSAYSQAELSERGAVGYEGLAETPGVVLNRPAANFNNFTARGISTNGYSAGLQAPVAVYIDELPISANGNSTILDPTLFDVERVEFLRGPQGTLFGSSSLSGAVRILTRNPELSEFDYSFLVDIGQTAGDSLRQRYNGMVNVPLVEDRVGMRLVGFYRNEEGYTDNIGTGISNSNTLESLGGRAIFLAEVTPRLTVRLMAQTEDSEPQDSSTINPTRGRFVRLSDRPDLFHSFLDVYNATITYDFGGAELTSSTTYSNYDQLFHVDIAGTFNQAIPFALEADAYDDILVEEVRLVSEPGGRWDWVIGGFYFDKRRDVDFRYRSTPEFLAARGITGLPDEYYQRFSNYTDINEQAIFGELVYRFTDDLWVTAGARYGGTDVQTTVNPGGFTSNYLTRALFGLSGPLTITPVASGSGLRAEDTGASYRLSLSYSPNPNITTYATYSTGFRAPVVNARAGQVSATDPTDIVIPDGADSDRLNNFELGVKGRWLGGRLNTNLAAFYIDWSDIQVQANRISDSVQFATNIGAAVSQGVEFEIAAEPFDNFYLGLSGAYIHAEVTELTAAEAAISGAVVGARLAAPEFSGTLSARYNFPIGSGDGYVSARLNHVGSFPGLFPNTPGSPGVPNPLFDYTDSYTNIDLSLGATFGDWMVQAYVENVADDDSITYVHPEAFVDGRYARLRPRTVGVRVGRNLYQ